MISVLRPDVHRGTVAVVTGGAAGIGRAVALEAMPVGRLGTAQEVSGLIAFLASPAGGMSPAPRSSSTAAPTLG